MVLSWREDSSNADQRFQRNWLRGSVLPTLEYGVPGISATLAGELCKDRQAARDQPHSGTAMVGY